MIISRSIYSSPQLAVPYFSTVRAVRCFVTPTSVYMASCVKQIHQLRHVSTVCWSTQTDRQRTGVRRSGPVDFHSVSPIFDSASAGCLQSWLSPQKIVHCLPATQQCHPQAPSLRQSPPPHVRCALWTPSAQYSVDLSWPNEIRLR